jgi:hypothetical protein
MVKTALISDIHANLEALEAVFAHIDEQEEIEKIYCLGDMVGYGPDPVAVVATPSRPGRPAATASNSNPGSSPCRASGIGGSSSTACPRVRRRDHTTLSTPPPATRSSSTSCRATSA